MEADVAGATSLGRFEVSFGHQETKAAGEDPKHHRRRHLERLPVDASEGRTRPRANLEARGGELVPVAAAVSSTDGIEGEEACGVLPRGSGEGDDTELAGVDAASLPGVEGRVKRIGVVGDLDDERAVTSVPSGSANWRSKGSFVLPNSSGNMDLVVSTFASR